MATRATRATTLVYMDMWRLLNYGPGHMAYHRRGRALCPKYIDDPEASARVGYPAVKMDPEHDREAHWTACGMLAYDSKAPRQIVMPSLRLDNAERVGRPCRRCWP